LASADAGALTGTAPGQDDCRVLEAATRCDLLARSGDTLLEIRKPNASGGYGTNA